MRCFIHRNEEAVASCKNCGKAMCIDCSAYSNHSGICPECRREDLIKIRNSKLQQVRELKSERIKSIIISVLLCILIIPILVGIYKVVTKTHRINELNGEAQALLKEIDKLNQALESGSKSII